MILGTICIALCTLYCIVADFTQANTAQRDPLNKNIDHFIILNIETNSGDTDNDPNLALRNDGDKLRCEGPLRNKSNDKDHLERVRNDESERTIDDALKQYMNGEMKQSISDRTKESLNGEIKQFNRDEIIRVPLNENEIKQYMNAETKQPKNDTKLFSNDEIKQSINEHDSPNVNAISLGNMDANKANADALPNIESLNTLLEALRYEFQSDQNGFKRDPLNQKQVSNLGNGFRDPLNQEVSKLQNENVFRALSDQPETNLGNGFRDSSDQVSNLRDFDISPVILIGSRDDANIDAKLNTGGVDDSERHPVAMLRRRQFEIFGDLGAVNFKPSLPPPPPPKH